MENDILAKFEKNIYNKCIIGETTKELNKEETICIKNYKKKIQMALDIIKNDISENWIFYRNHI
jgi:hypothetical protein